MKHRQRPSANKTASKRAQDTKAERRGAPAKRSSRADKPPVARSEPIRNFATLIGLDTSKASTTKGKQRSKEKKGDIENGVGVAYAVIDDYIRQGRVIAERVMPSPETAGAFARELPQVTERMFRYASDFASVWLEAMGMVAAGAARQSSTPAEPTMAGAWTAPVESPRPPARAGGSPNRTPVLQVVIDSSKRVAVSLRLPAGSTQTALEARGVLKASSKRKAASIEVNASVFPGMVELRVSVPKSAPAGSFQGRLLQTGTQHEVGTFTIEVKA